jgi:O-antigen ligase
MTNRFAKHTNRAAIILRNDNGCTQHAMALCTSEGHTKMSSPSWAIAFDHQRLLRLADWLAFGVAVSLPWSTSATSILIVLWLIAVLPTLNTRLVWREVASPAGGLPVVLWIIAALGMLWADVPWRDRFFGLDGYNRLLIIPLLLAQFRRSDRGAFVLYGYLVSAVFLLMTSWALALIPAFSSYGNFYGVPVKDYILQTDEFLVCGFALLGIGSPVGAHQARRVSWLLIAISILFLANLAFVFTSRTGLLVAPFLVAALGWRLSGTKGLMVACLVAVVLSPILWLTSPRLRDFTLNSISDMRAYFATNAATSGGLHIEYLRRSIEIIEKAPLVGHGTGSIAQQFRGTAAGDSGAKSAVSVNPHNQIFAVAIQVGSLGAIVLVAMWIAHFMLFRGGSLAAWTGMVVVIENVVSSAVNSHLFDFSQGWLYVFGVGVAGGMVLKNMSLTASAADANSRDMTNLSFAARKNHEEPRY